MTIRVVFEGMFELTKEGIVPLKDCFAITRYREGGVGKRDTLEVTEVVDTRFDMEDLDLLVDYILTLPSYNFPEYYD